MLRTEDGRRTLARVAADDAATLAHLRDMERSAVGSLGDIGMAGDGAPQWRVG
jgi:acetyl-CoA C-acetyltransferase